MLAGAEPRTRRRGLKVPATAHGRAAGHGYRAGQSRNGIFKRKKIKFLNAYCAIGLSLTVPSCLPLQHTHSFIMLSYLYQSRLEASTSIQGRQEKIAPNPIRSQEMTVLDTHFFQHFCLINPTCQVQMNRDATRLPGPVRPYSVAFGVSARRLHVSLAHARMHARHSRPQHTHRVCPQPHARTQTRLHLVWMA